MSRPRPGFGEGPDHEVDRVAGEERDRLYSAKAALLPAFAEYEARTTRRIPVVALERRQD